MARNCVFSTWTRSASGIASQLVYVLYRSKSFCARMANMVPRLSTCTFTPISNMSAAGAMMTSACPAAASIARTASELPDSTHAWFTLPVTT